jgi:hypothetical protein
VPSEFIRKQRLRFTNWWHSPIRRRDRLLGAVIGALACFWIAGLGRLAFDPPTVSLGQLAAWALGGLLLGAAFGARHPRLATCLLLPFGLFGIST